MSTMSEGPLILIVDDEAGFRESLGILVRTRLGAKVVLASTADEALDRLGRAEPDVVISDVFMEGEESGLRVLEATRRVWPHVPVILMSAVASRAAAIAAVNNRAFWFLEKPFGTDQLLGLLRQAVAARQAGSVSGSRPAAPRLATQRRHNQPGQRRTAVPVLVSHGAALTALWDRVRSVIDTPDPVLVVGERGMGASRLAREISERRAAPRDQLFVPPLSQRGALLTGWAAQVADGAQTPPAAARGTVLLEDPASLDSTAQVAWSDLLTPREEGGLLPVAGRDRPWWLVTTTPGLEDEVVFGKLRGDLYHKLAVHVITLPTWAELADVHEDVVGSLLASVQEEDPRRVLEGVTDEAMEAISQGVWGGGLREVRTRLVRAADRGVVRATAQDLGLARGRP